MASDLGWSVPVIVRSKAQLGAVLDHIPSARRSSTRRPCTSRSWPAAPVSAAVEALDAEAGRFGNDRVTVVGQEAYLHCPGGYGQTKLNNAFLERRLGCAATTRNWRTVTTLAGMAGLEV